MAIIHVQGARLLNDATIQVEPDARLLSPSKPELRGLGTLHARQVEAAAKSNRANAGDYRGLRQSNVARTKQTHPTNEAVGLVLEVPAPSSRPNERTESAQSVHSARSSHFNA